MNLEYSIVYSDRKTLQIIVERDRSVVVRAPHNTSPERINDAIEKKKLWLYEKINHPQKYSPTQSKTLIPGSSVLYLGKEYRLDVTNREIEGIIFDSRFIISKSSLPEVLGLLRAWYIDRANATLVPRIQYYAKHVGVEYNRILISDLKYRWGSCTPKSNLNFNWRLIKAPVSVIEYVIVHELAHLLEPNHNTKFWNIVRTQIPQYQRAKEWLKKNGQILDEDCSSVIRNNP
jgi:predicted metal-dependent hydrolase